jgi:hypothetical protein
MYVASIIFGRAYPLIHAFVRDQAARRIGPFSIDLASVSATLGRGRACLGEQDQTDRVYGAKGDHSGKADEQHSILEAT